MNLKTQVAIKIIKPGIFTTIQDLGRSGYRSVGIGPGGAMDYFAATVGNFLVGNDENCPVIEMHFPAAEILFEEDALISVTGGNFGGLINGEPMAIWKPVLIKKNERLSFKKYTNGARNYLSIRGGINAKKWLKSFSTHTKVKAGGHYGRVLLKEDSLLLNSGVENISIKKFPDINALISPVYRPANLIRCIAGPEWDLMTDESQTLFPALPFSVSAQSDRMGYRLKGIQLSLQGSDQLISSPVDEGTIQLLANGQLIVLMADHQTTGGYPRIANVIRADLPKLAQTSINSTIQFEMIDLDTATKVLVSTYQTLELIRNNCKNYYDAC